MECSGRGRVDVFTCKDRITKVVPWSILGGTSVQRIGTKDEEGSILGKGRICTIRFTGGNGTR